MCATFLVEAKVIYVIRALKSQLYVIGDFWDGERDEL